MGKVHICLKRSFIAIASVIAIINSLLLVLVLIVHAVYMNSPELASQLKDIHYMYIFTVIPLVLVVFGLVGVCKKKKWAVIVFTAGMILMSLIVFLVSIVMLGNKSEIAEEIRKEYQDIGTLSETSEDFQEQLSDQQTQFQCCGLNQGYTDWGDEIPLSCECTGQPLTNPCVELKTAGNKVFRVYEKPCLPYLVEEDMHYVNIGAGVMIALSMLWTLSVVLSIFILCKFFEKERSPAVVYRS